MTELDLLDLNILASSADDGLAAAVTLADWLLEVLRTLSRDNHTRLLHFARKAAKQALGGFLGIFLGNLYHIRSIVP